MAELIAPYGFSYTSFIEDGGNIDNVGLDTGFYILKTSNVTTLPNGVNTNILILLHINTTDGVAAQLLIQRSPKMFLRASSGTGWSDWVTIY